MYEEGAQNLAVFGVDLRSQVAFGVFELLDGGHVTNPSLCDGIEDGNGGNNDESEAAPQTFDDGRSIFVLFFGAHSRCDEINLVKV